MSIIVVGTIGYDRVETQHGGVTDALGGSASFFALAARFFSPVSIVAVVGSDFKPDHMRLFAERNIDVRGLVRREGPTFRWHGRHDEPLDRQRAPGLDQAVAAARYPHRQRRGGADA